MGAAGGQPFDAIAQVVIQQAIQNRVGPNWRGGRRQDDQVPRLGFKVMKALERRGRQAQRPRGGFLRHQSINLARPDDNRLPDAALRQIQVAPAQHAQHHPPLHAADAFIGLVEPQQMLVDGFGRLPHRSRDGSGGGEVCAGRQMSKMIDQSRGQRLGRLQAQADEDEILRAAAGRAARRGQGQRPGWRRDACAAAGEVDQGNIGFEGRGHGAILLIPPVCCKHDASRGPGLVQSAPRSAPGIQHGSRVCA